MHDPIKFPHVVQLKSYQEHVLAWCKQHVPETEWHMWWDLDADYEWVFYAFRDDHMAMQFALMFT